jgi:hypothetical protein
MKDYKDNQAYFKKPATIKDHIIKSLKMVLVGWFILYLMFHALYMGISGRL